MEGLPFIWLYQWEFLAALALCPALLPGRFQAEFKVAQVIEVEPRMLNPECYGLARQIICQQNEP